MHSSRKHPKIELSKCCKAKVDEFYHNEGGKVMDSSWMCQSCKKECALDGSETPAHPKVSEPQGGWIKEFDRICLNMHKSPITDGRIITEYIQELILKERVKAKEETLDMVAGGEGWEASRDYWAKKLGLPTKYS